MKRIKFSYQEVSNIIELYDKGMTQKEIAAQYLSYNTSIRRVLLKYGKLIRGNEEIQAKVKTNKFKDLDKITTYWLGWIATDGCVSKGTIDLTCKDEYVIRNYANWMGINYRKNNDGTYSARFKSSINVKQLKKYGITERKSHNLKLKTPITFEMLRGIIEGDGWIKKSTIEVGICSKSYKFIRQIQRFLLKNNYKVKLRCSKVGLFILTIYGKNQMFKLYADLYSGAEANFLPRKHNRLYGYLTPLIRGNYASNPELANSGVFSKYSETVGQV